MKQIFDWMRGAILDKAFKIYDGTIAVDIHDVGNIINEAEAKWGGHAICYLDSPCEYQNEDIRVDDGVDYCELLDKLIEETPQYRHRLCAFRNVEECVSFEYCENCVFDAIKECLKNTDSRFKNFSEVE